MKKKSLEKVLLVVFLGVWFSMVGISQNTQDPGVMLRSAIEKEEVEGDLQGALEIYRKITEQFSGDKAIAAQAQLRIGLCHEKLGKKNIKLAQVAFQKVIDNYPSQSEEVKKARDRLSSLIRARTVPEDKGFSVTELDYFLPDGIWRDPFGLSPDGTKLLGVEFTKGQNIVVCDLKNQKAKFITDYDWGETSSWTYHPVWSPDGKEIAYNANANKKGPSSRRLMISTLDGQSRVLLSSNEKDYFFPNAWLPDGSAILTIKENLENPNQLGLVPREGGSFKKLVSLQGADLSNGQASACVSPDGQYVLFTDSVPGEKSDIYIIKTKGGASTSLVKHPAADKHPRWSPDGKHVVFLSLRHGSWALWGVTVEEGKAAGDPFIIREGMKDARLLNWTSNGLASWNWISIRDIYLMDVDPETGEPVRKPRQLEYTPTGGNRFPVWSPDGRYLAFLREDDTTRRRYINVLRADGSDSREFPVPRGYARGGLRWMPDGGGIGMNTRWNRGNILLSLRFDTEKWEEITIPVAVEEGWTRFEWSGNGKAFFYSKNGMPEQGAGIYERNLETGAERLIYHNPDSRVNFRWLKCSRDYKWLAFVESNTKNMVVNLETGESHLAASRQGFCSWSSDGQKMLGLRAYGESEGYKKALRVFSASGGSVKEFELSKGLPERGRFSAPDWSPDGKQVVFGLTQGKSDVLLYKNIIPNEKK